MDLEIYNAILEEKGENPFSNIDEKGKGRSCTVCIIIYVDEAEYIYFY